VVAAAAAAAALAGSDGQLHAWAPGSSRDPGPFFLHSRCARGRGVLSRVTPARLLPALAAGVVTAAVVLALVRGPGSAPEAGSRAPDRHRGVSWVAGPPITVDDLRPLVADGVTWIVQTPFGWQNGVTSPEVRMATGGRVLWGESDAGLTATAAYARSLGIRTLLKPHLWIHRFEGGWRGDIAMGSEADWGAWFASYREFILHYARLAAEDSIEALCIGTELHRTVVERPDDWRRLIADIRAVYPGKLTYAANWYLEFEEVPFWDLLDYIGVQGYFPLCDHDHPTEEELVAAWAEPKARLEELSKRMGKPVLFTEVGYRSMPDAAVHPWEWPERRGDFPVDEETQAVCYRAFYAAFWKEPWVAGVYWWKWFPEPGQWERPWGFSPQGKAAEAVLRSW